MLLGAVGGPKWDGVPGDKRPEKGLLGIRSAHGPVRQPAPGQAVPAAGGRMPPASRDIVEKGIDFMVVRELIGGVYFGEHKTEDSRTASSVATDVMPYCRA